MKKYIIGGIVASVVVIAALAIANYFTCFAYYLPHKPAIIYVAPEDTVARSYPSFVALNWTKGAESNRTVIIQR